MRHKRQALQDMARPLKQWLYKHRDNPYPTKTEKILLALGSQMTLVQVRKERPILTLGRPRRAEAFARSMHCVRGQKGAVHAGSHQCGCWACSPPPPLPLGTSEVWQGPSAKSGVREGLRLTGSWSRAL